MNLATPKEIAAALRERATEYPETTDQSPETIVNLGGFVVRCRPCRPAVERCAAKCDKPRRLKLAPAPPKYRKPGRGGLERSPTSGANRATRRTPTSF